MIFAAIILAAGRARRFGAGPHDSKVLAKIEGVSMLRRVAAAAAGSRASSVVAVSGHAPEKIEAELDGFGFDIRHNDQPDLGLSQSLRLGLDAAPPEADGAVILLADMPFVSAALIDALIAAFEVATPRPLAVAPVYRGMRGNPVLLDRRLFARVKEIQGDRGARGLLDSLGEEVLEVPVETDAILRDIDTPEMLAAIFVRR